MAEGFVLSISPAMLKRLDEADGKISKLQTTSDKTSSKIIDDFRRMAAGVDPFMEKIKNVNNLLSKLSAPNISIKGFKETATDGEKAAKATASITESLNKIKSNPIDDINKKIASLKELLNQATRSVEEYSRKMASIRSTGSGMISGTTIKEGGADVALIPQIQAQIAALEQEKKSISSSQVLWQQRLDALNNSSLATQRQVSDLAKLNESFRTGQSELQKQAKAQDDLAKAAEKSAAAADKQAAAEAKRNAQAQKKSDTSAERALEKYNNALNKSEVTIANRARKIEALANAERTLIKTGRDYTLELTKIRTETERLNKANVDAANSVNKVKSNQRSLIDTSGQLQRKLALLFSISQIEGYVMKMVNIRGEFELQNVALRAILQNKDEADRLFGQITELAVRSPFRVKELVTYTKELAAYRVESSKLYDTTKMLADVSAGLGVDMSRLILAFGQVKAANYLRGTELRQFSEAGINILGELSTYFTELEGRIVSVGDVFERVSKRMVSFGDVENIFNRITSAGGIFYNMQEIQAETLAGQISNLADSMDLMFNEMGKSNESVLKTTVGLLRSMLENWEAIANTLVPLLTSFALYKGIIYALIGYEKLMIAYRAISNGQLALQQGLIIRSASAQVAFNVASKANPYLIIGAVLLSAIMGVYYAIKSSREEQEKFNRNVSDGIISASELSANFKRLADTATDSSKSSKEQNVALAELKRTYSDILPFQSLQIENLKAMKGNYDAVTSAIYAKIEAQTKDKLSQDIQAEYGGKAAKSTDDMIKKLKQLNISTDKSRTILSEFRKRFDEGFITSPQKAQVELENLIKVYTGKSVSLTQKGFFSEDGMKSWGNIVMPQVSDLYNSFNDLSLKMREMSEMKLSPFQEFGGTALYGSFKSQLDGIATFTAKWKEENEDKLNPFELNEEAQAQTINKYKEFIDKITTELSAGKYKGTDIEIAKKAIDDAQKSIDNFNGSKIQQEVKNIFMTFAQVNKVPLDGMEKLFLGSEEGLTEYAKRVKDLLDDFKERISLFEKNPFLSPFSKEQIDFMRQQVPLIENQYNSTHVEIQKGKNDADKTALQLLKERISLIKETNSQYEKLLQNYNKEEAANKVRASYKDTFAELFKGTEMEGTIATMDFDVSGAIAALEELLKTAAGKARLEAQKALDGLRARVNLDVVVERTDEVKSELEDLFSGYELSLELEKLNIPPELAKQLFNVDVFNLDELQKKAAPYLAELRAQGGNQIKVADDIEKKISDMQYKANVDRLKNYSAYLRRSMSERVNIELDGLRKIEELNKTEGFTEGQRKVIKTQIEEETTKKVEKQTFEDFKNTDLYIQMFEDLDRTSSNTLERMKAKLGGIRDSLKNLDPQQLKEIQSRLSEIDAQLIERNPFKGLISNLKDYAKNLKNVNDLEEKSAKSQDETDKQQDLVDTLAVQLELSKERKAVIDDNVNSTDLEKATAQATVDVIENNLNVQAAILAEKKKISIEDAKDLAIEQAKTRELSMQIQSVGSIGGQAVGSMQEMMGMLENFGVEFGDEVGGVLSGLGQAFAGLEQIDLTKPMSIISGAVGVVAGIGNAIASVFGAGNKDKKKERQIQRELQLIDKLQKSYEKLEKAIDNAYSLDTLQSANKAAKANLQEQIAATERAIAAEDAKKKTDHARIEEMREEIEGYKEQLKELEEQRLESLGGFGSEANYKYAAEEFANAWYDAYKETGDGLTGLEDTFDSFIDNIVKKQLLLRGTQQLLDPLLKMIDGVVSDGIVDLKEMEKIEGQWQDQTKPALDALYKMLADQMGIMGGQADAELSGLQRGIQAITEPTAQALESLLNSMRFFVADSNTQIKNIYALFANADAPNPILSELKAQTMLVRSIYDLFNGMTAPHPTFGKRALLTVI